MSNYYHRHILQLQREARIRFDRLIAVLTPHAVINVQGHEVMDINGRELRLAVDDFKTLLLPVPLRLGVGVVICWPAYSVGCDP